MTSTMFAGHAWRETDASALSSATKNSTKDPKGSARDFAPCDNATDYSYAFFPFTTFAPRLSALARVRVELAIFFWAPVAFGRAVAVVTRSTLALARRPPAFAGFLDPFIPTHSSIVSTIFRIVLRFAMV